MCIYLVFYPELYSNIITFVICYSSIIFLHIVSESLHARATGKGDAASGAGKDKA